MTARVEWAVVCGLLLGAVAGCAGAWAVAGRLVSGTAASAALGFGLLLALPVLAVSSLVRSVRL